MSIADTVGIPFPLIPGRKEPQHRLSWRVVAPGEYRAEGDHGLALFPSVLVLDFDRYKNPSRDLAAEFLAKYPHMQFTRIIYTPSGGLHIYTRKPVDTHVKKTQAAYPGVDFLSVGEYACGEGTRLDYTNDQGRYIKGVYTSVGGVVVLPCPQDFLDGLERPAEAHKDGAAESLENEPEFIGICRYEPPSNQGHRGIDSYRLAARGKDLALPLSVVYQHMRDLWNPRNLPPQPDLDMYKECEHAYKYGRNAVGSHSAAAIFSQVAVPGRANETNGSQTQILGAVGVVDSQTPGHVRSNGDRSNTTPRSAQDTVVAGQYDYDQGNGAAVVSIDDFQHKKIMETIFRKAVVYDKKGELPLPSMGNVVYYLKHDDAWRGRLMYNMFTESIEIKGRPSWRRNRKSKGEALTKFDMAFIQTWFSTNHEIELGPDKVITAAMAAATQYHPVLDYLDGIVWDGRPRLDGLFVDTLGCMDNAYTREAAKLFLLSAVKRIYEPGCKLDYVVVLESKQGTKKSQWVAALGGPFASTGELVRGDKDTYQNMRGKWIIELPEIDATFSKQDVAWLKKIITIGTDHYRPSYAPQSEDVPRESVFIATINPSCTNQYLRDDENRRYWPIKTGKISVKKLEENRDQYFAEAVYRYKSGESNWEMTAESARMAHIEQELRKETDPWEESLEEWCATTWATKGAFSINEAFYALGSDAERRTARIRERMYRVLKILGYTYHPTSKKWYGTIDWGRLL